MRNALNKRPNRPSKPRRNRARQRYGLNLHINPTVALLITPISGHLPEKTMLLFGAERSLPICSRRIDFRDLRTARDAVAMPRVKPAKAYIVTRIHHYRDDMTLANPHHCLKPIAMLRKHPGLNHLRREVPRISAEIPHQPLKISHCRSCSKSRPAPVVQHRSGHIRARRGSQPLHDQFSLPQPLLGLRSRNGSKKALLRPMLLGQPRLNSADILVKGRDSRSRSFPQAVTRSPHKSQQNSQPPNTRSDRKFPPTRTPCHEQHLTLPGRFRRCRKSHLLNAVGHGASDCRKEASGLLVGRKLFSNSRSLFPKRAPAA